MHLQGLSHYQSLRSPTSTKLVPSSSKAAARTCQCSYGREGRLGLGPTDSLGSSEALEIQLKALQVNNTPYNNHGIEVAYRFAKFDPFERSSYFGRNLDLGQFERFKRVFFTPHFQPLVGHASASVLSRLQLTSDCSKTRVLVQHGLQGERSATYEVTLIRDQAGVHKGLWMTQSFKRDAVDAADIRSCL